MKSGNKPEAGKVKALTQKQSIKNVETSNPTKSARYYDQQTQKLLWGRSAGRCAMSDCRIELFVTTDGYDPVCIIGEMGHVTASSNAGPRANAELDVRSRDTYTNLILLCRNCHRKVDTFPNIYTEHRLFEIKANHEAWVRIALPERGFSNVRWKVLRLQGAFPFDAVTIPGALTPDQEGVGVEIIVSGTQDSWASIQEGLRDKIHNLATEMDSVSSRIAVFPLAAVSACVFTGYLLTNRLNVRAFQYHRDESTWKWPDNPEGLTMPSIEERTQPMSASAEVFFLFELSAPVDASELQEKIGGVQAVYRCSVPTPSTAWLKSKMQLDALARNTREMFERAAIRYPRSNRWHILFAGPAPGGVVVGQQLNPTMIPNVQLYEFQRPRHIPTITITPGDSLLTRWTAGSATLKD
jgi:5-methylcytosine-specific restriction endonuclease McrA